MLARNKVPVRILILVLLFDILSAGLYTLNAAAQVIYEDFTATVTQEGKILVEWWTDSEVGNKAFYVQRSNSEQGTYTRIEESYTLTESVDGEGGYYYFYEDANIFPNQFYYYRLEAIDILNNSTFIGPIDAIFQVLITPMLTQTSSPSPQPTNRNTTAPQAIVTATWTVRPFDRITITPSPMGTRQETEDSNSIFEGNITVTPEQTKTFEPLPTIELIFPNTSTSELSKNPEIKEQKTGQVEPEITPPVEKLMLQNLPKRLLVSAGIVGILWLCLGVFLIFMVRKFNE